MWHPGLGRHQSRTVLSHWSRLSRKEKWRSEEKRFWKEIVAKKSLEEGEKKIWEEEGSSFDECWSRGRFEAEETRCPHHKSAAIGLTWVVFPMTVPL